MTNTNYLVHHGIEGQKWGVRRYQNADGTLTPEGLKRYRDSDLHERDTATVFAKQNEMKNVKAPLTKKAKIIIGASLGSSPAAMLMMGIVGATVPLSAATAFVIPPVAIAALTAAVTKASIRNKKVSELTKELENSKEYKRLDQLEDQMYREGKRRYEALHPLEDIDPYYRTKSNDPLVDKVRSRNALNPFK